MSHNLRGENVTIIQVYTCMNMDTILHYVHVVEGCYEGTGVDASLYGAISLWPIKCPCTQSCDM